jgi:hypothetical protein
MNVSIPGIDPWDEVKHNPYIMAFCISCNPDII